MKVFKPHKGNLHTGGMEKILNNDILNKLLAIIIILLFCIESYPQNKRLDSLKLLLSAEKTDTGKVILLNKMSRGFGFGHLRNDSSLWYSQQAPPSWVIMNAASVDDYNYYKAMKPCTDGFHTKPPDFNSLKQRLGEKKLF